MKKLFTLVIVLFAFVTNAMADECIRFENPSIRFENTGGIMTYDGQEIRFYWADGNIYNPNFSINNDYNWHAKAVGDIKLINANNAEVDEMDLTVKNNTQYPVRFKGEGSIIVTVNRKEPFNGKIFYSYYVITVPYTGNHVWDFFSGVTPRTGTEAQWKSGYKIKQEHPIKIVNENETNIDGYKKINGTNAFFIPETSGLLFEANENNFGYNNTNLKLVTWGGKKGNGDKAKFTIPSVQGGKYIKIWWNTMHQGESGAHFRVNDLLDLEGTEITNEFGVTGVHTESKCEGVTIFKVKGNPNERKNITFTLTDEGWNDLYKIEITDVYSTDMILVDQMQGNDKEVLYNMETGHFVVPETELNQAHYYTDNGDRPYMTFIGASGYARVHRAKTCRFTVEQEPNNSVVDWTERRWTTQDGKVEYYNLDFTKIKGTGNVKIIQKEYFNGYVLDKKETWIAIGTYKQQSYPYTWDFTDYNVSQGSLYAWLSGSNTYGTQKYGHWKMENSETYALETHEQVNGTILNGQTNQLEKIHKPLFAQGAQLTYWKQDNTIGTIKEAEGLRVKQAWGTKGELAVGEDFDGELSINGKCLKYTPAGEWSRLHITIPNVDAGMYVFIKADDGTEAENYANPSVKLGNSELTADNSYNTKNKVRAYKVTATGDVDITFAKAAQIKAIGVTNIFKSINALGYATESRDVDIDHIYEGEFTKNDVNAYCIQTYNDEGFTYEYKGTPIVKKSQVMNVIPKNTGIVLYKEGHSGDAFNVPLFYPACNAKVKEAEQIALDNNWMAPNVKSTLHESETEMRGSVECQKFVMSRQYYVYHRNSDGTGTDSEEKTSEQEAFYRMRLKEGGNNTMGANKAYLLIPMSKLPTALWNGGNGAGVAGQAKPGVIFMDDIMDLFGGDEPISGIATAIDTIEPTETVGNGYTFHTLSGMQIQGVPTQKGVYIVNGKKVLVK
jgi:hypothetical protein